MGQSHFKSNFIGKTGNEYIASVAAVKNISAISGTTVTGGTVTSTGPVIAGNYMRVGANQYIFAGSVNTGASIVAEATALVATPIKGSMYMSTKGNMWFLVDDSTASPVQSLA